MYDHPVNLIISVFLAFIFIVSQVTLVSADQSESELLFHFDSAAQTITVKKPDARVVDAWSVKFTF